MNPQRYYSQINLAPLLDVVFVTLFVIVLSVGTQQVGAREEQLQEQQADLIALQTERDALRATLAARNRTLRESEDALAAATADTARTQQQLDAVERELATVRDEAALDAAAYQQEIDDLQDQLQMAQSDIAVLERDLAALDQQQTVLSDTLTLQDDALTQSTDEAATLRRALARAQDALVRREDALQGTLRAVEDELDRARDQLADLGEMQRQREAEMLELQNANERLTADLQRAQEALARAEQRAAEYRTQSERLAELIAAEPDEPALASLKAEFVDRYIDLYTIEIAPSERGVSRLQLTNKNNNVAEQTVSNEEQVIDFLRRELSQFEKDRTLIIFIKAPDSLYQHEQWVEEYLQRNDFPYGEWRRG